MRQCREERGDRHHLLVVEEERIMPDILADGVNRSARWGQVGTEEPERVIKKSRVVMPSRGNGQGAGGLEVFMDGAWKKEDAS